jgi:hypothetical protein
MFGAKSKFNLDKIKTQAIKLGLAEISTSDSELEQLCLNALTAHSESQESPEEDEEEFFQEEKQAKSKGKKTAAKAGKKAVKSKNTEADDDDDDEDDDESDDDADTQAHTVPVWFTGFAKKLDKKFGEVEANLKALARVPKGSTADTKRDTGSANSRTKENAPYYLQDPKNKKLLTKWLASSEDNDE